MTNAIDRHDWLQALHDARQERVPAVLVTVSEVVGHSPRDPGAKMVVTDATLTGTIGGGNLEAMAVEQARGMLATMRRGGAATTQTWADELTEHVRGAQRHGRQCCGGRVSVLLEPFAPRPSVAIVGIGHVGVELARLLARHPVELHLVDSRSTQLDESALRDVSGPARVTPHHDLLPEAVLARVPRETHVLVMTHDHAEDYAVIDAVLRDRERYACVGLIGSTAKWRRFERRLRAAGHPEELIGSLTCPVGHPGIVGKEPAVVALSIAADLVPRLLNRQKPAAEPRRTTVPVAEAVPERQAETA